eukprot:GHVT01004227.1.p1 GENE.GHVT01004227.1~~GHVT01004227.1.p1  ORF type:complete len:513 (-),score=154.09 GHVT01004227.1:1283-2821(-)
MGALCGRTPPPSSSSDSTAPAPAKAPPLRPPHTSSRPAANLVVASSSSSASSFCPSSSQSSSYKHPKVIVLSPSGSPVYLGEAGVIYPPSYSSSSSSSSSCAFHPAIPARSCCSTSCGSSTTETPPPPPPSDSASAPSPCVLPAISTRTSRSFCSSPFPWPPSPSSPSSSCPSSSTCAASSPGSSSSAAGGRPKVALSLRRGLRRSALRLLHQRALRISGPPKASPVRLGSAATCGPCSPAFPCAACGCAAGAAAASSAASSDPLAPSPQPLDFTDLDEAPPNGAPWELQRASASKIRILLSPQAFDYLEDNPPHAEPQPQILRGHTGTPPLPTPDHCHEARPATNPNQSQAEGTEEGAGGKAGGGAVEAAEVEPWKDPDAHDSSSHEILPTGPPMAKPPADELQVRVSPAEDRAVPPRAGGPESDVEKTEGRAALAQHSAGAELDEEIKFGSFEPRTPADTRSLATTPTQTADEPEDTEEERTIKEPGDEVIEEAAENRKEAAERTRHEVF